MKVCNVAEIRRLDKSAIEDYRVPAEILMEDAGASAYHVIHQRYGIEGKKFVVLCGPGNNGGDGFVVARHLHAAGASVTVCILADTARYKGEAKKNLEMLSRFPVNIKELTSARHISAALNPADIIIDAMLGTGLDRAVEGIILQAIKTVNRSGKKVCAIDVPSGINGNNGQIMGSAVVADCTITFGLPKLGNLLYPGYGHGGKLFVSHLSYPHSLSTSPEIKVELAPPLPLPERRATTNKFSYGPVLVIAGAADYFWAPHASAYSFLKAGGGYVYLACPASMASSVAKRGREVVFQPMRETASGSIAMNNIAALTELAQRMKMVVLGPGLSLDGETQTLVRELVVAIDKPLLIDGDGITAIAKDTKIIGKRKAPTILTPHTGEMERITGKTREQIENNRVEITQETAVKLKAYIVLKGPHSLIACPNGKVYINVSGATRGRAGMATAGSGDVLNGTIAAVYCLGLDIEDAVRTGVFIHGFSGDLAAKTKGADGMTAQDILNTLPRAVRYYRDNLPQIRRDYYGALHEV